MREQNSCNLFGEYLRITLLGGSTILQTDKEKKNEIKKGGWEWSRVINWKGLLKNR